MKIMWDVTGLSVFEGDEIEILRGYRMEENFDFDIRATTVQNVSRGGIFSSKIEKYIMVKPLEYFHPPLRGYVNELEIHTNTYFQLTEKGSPIIKGILRESAPFIDSQLFERCKDKDYHDVVTNAFTVLEERIRSLIGVDPSYTGTKLIDYAFNPKNGKASLGKISSEKESFYMLLRGALGFLRNPAAHRFISTDDDAEILEIIYFVNMLLRMIEKARVF